jgi:uncharacterized membrane protein YphA (DoxX/SURF4 family)
MSESASWQRIVGLASAVLLGLVFLVAAWAKVLDPIAFAEQISREGLDFLVPAGPMAILAIGLEIGLGLALVLGMRQLWVLLPTGGLVVLFLSLTGRTYWMWSRGLLDDEAGCGCFGNLVQRTPAEAFWQDLLMLVPLYALAWLGRRVGERTGVPLGRAVVVGAAVVAGSVFAWRAPSLPLDDLATRLRPGVAVEEICTGGQTDADSVCLDVLIPSLAAGNHWVVISELDNESFLEGMDGLNRLAVDPQDGPLTVLSADPAEAHQAFFWQQGPAFDVREVPLALIRPLYRMTPRAFRLEDGIVTRTVAGLPGEVGSAIATPDD